MNAVHHVKMTIAPQNDIHERNKGAVCSSWLTDCLRTRLADILAEHNTSFAPSVLDVLRPWAEQDANIEGLAEWLGNGGWDGIDGIDVEARLSKNATPGDLELGKKLTVAFHFEKGLAAILHYVIPRAEQKDHPQLPVEMEWNQNPYDGMNLPTTASIHYGLDALKIGFANMEWQGIAKCIPAAPNKTNDWLRLLAGNWLEAREARETKRQDRAAKAVPLAIQARNVIRAKSTGADFLRFPSMLKDAGAWCSSLVEVDGNTIFAEEPDLAAAPVRVVKDADGKPLNLFKPRAWTIAAEHLLENPGHQQMILPGLNLDPKQNPDLGAWLALSATGAAVADGLPGLCAKLMPLLFALCPLDGTPVKGPVQALVKLLYPDWKSRRQMAGDVVRVGAAAAALYALRVVEAQPSGAIRFYPVLIPQYYDVPTGPNQPPETCLQMNPALADLATPAKGKGDFVLVNLSRLMDLDARSPEKIAVALRLAAYWHTCKQRTADGRRVFMPDRLDFMPVDNLLVTSNAVSERVAEVIAGADRGQMGKRKLSEARARMLDETLPALKDAGLVGEITAPRSGDRRGAWTVKAAPPADYLEASAKTGRTRRPPLKARRPAAK